jgi:hypothetical protein
MKSVRLLCAILSLSLNPLLYAQDFTNKKQAMFISAPEKALDTKEVLRYSVEWLGIPAGKVILKVEGLENIKGYACYHITAEAQPNRFLRRIYDIEYKVHTYIDAQSFLTRRFEKTRRINNNVDYTVIDFNQEKNEATFLLKGSNVTFSISSAYKKIEANNPITNKIPPATQDLLSSFYYFRLLDIKENQDYPVNIYYNCRNWAMHMRVGKPFLREIRKKGNFPVVGVFPDTELNDYILGRRKFTVYLTIDSRRIPIEFKIQTAIGPIRAIIEDSPK